MPESGSLIPVSDEQAKAIQEALKALQGFGGFFREILGTVPEDLIGYFGGDALKIRRAENFARILQGAQERLEARGAKIEKPASLSLVLPIAVASADESRDELQDLWARLLAAAADPARAKFFRLAFIEAAKKMDPLDAAVLRQLHEHNGPFDGNARQKISGALRVSRDEVDVSGTNLLKLGLLTSSPMHDPATQFISPLGREFLRAVSN